MKMFLLTTVLTAITQLASARVSNLEYSGPVTGIVKIQTKSAPTCMAIGCPPSVRYTQISLLKATVTGYRSELAEVILNEEERRVQSNAPQFVVLKGTRIKNGQKVEVVGKTLVRIYNLGRPVEVYATMSDIESVKLVR